jgi:hypothetical protein
MRMGVTCTRRTAAHKRADCSSKSSAMGGTSRGRGRIGGMKDIGDNILLVIADLLGDVMH